MFTSLVLSSLIGLASAPPIELASCEVSQPITFASNDDAPLPPAHPLCMCASPTSRPNRSRGLLSRSTTARRLTTMGHSALVSPSIITFGWRTPQRHRPSPRRLHLQMGRHGMPNKMRRAAATCQSIYAFFISLPYANKINKLNTLKGEPFETTLRFNWRLRRNGACGVLRRAARFDSEPGSGGGAPQASSTSVVADSLSKSEYFAGANKATALILVANENTGLGGSIREYAENANGNVAASTVISHINGPYAVAFNPTEGIGIANGNVVSGGQAGLQTFGLAGALLTGISCFPDPTQTSAVAFDSKGRLFVSAFLPEGGRAVEIFAPGANGCVKPRRTISDAGGLAIDSHNLLYVANSDTATIDIFPAGSSTMQAQIGGNNTGLGAPGNGFLPGDTVAVDASLNVYVFDPRTCTDQRRSPPERPATSHRSAPFPVRTPD